MNLVEEGSSKEWLHALSEEELGAVERVLLALYWAYPRFLTAAELHRTSGVPTPRLAKLLPLLVREDELEARPAGAGRGLPAYSLSGRGGRTAHGLLEAYLEDAPGVRFTSDDPADREVIPPEPGDLGPAHLALLAYFDGTTHEHPKPLSAEFRATHRHPEMASALQSAELAELLAGKYLIQGRKDKFGVYWLPPKGRVALRRHEGFALAPGELTPWQWAALQRLQGTTARTPVSYWVLEVLDAAASASRSDLKAQCDALEYAALIESSWDEWHEHGYYLLPAGQAMLEATGRAGVEPEPTDPAVVLARVAARHPDAVIEPNYDQRGRLQSMEFQGVSPFWANRSRRR